MVWAIEKQLGRVPRNIDEITKGNVKILIDDLLEELKSQKNRHGIES